MSLVMTQHGVQRREHRSGKDAGEGGKQEKVMEEEPLKGKRRRGEIKWTAAVKEGRLYRRRRQTGYRESWERL